MHMGIPAKDRPHRAHLGWVGKPRAAGRRPGGHPCVLGDSSTPRCPVTCSSQPTHPLLGTSGMVPDGDGHSTLARLRWEMAPPCPHSPATSPQHSTVGIPTFPVPQGAGREADEEGTEPGRIPVGSLAPGGGGMSTSPVPRSAVATLAQQGLPRAPSSWASRAPGRLLLRTHPKSRAGLGPKAGAAVVPGVPAHTGTPRPPRAMPTAVRRWLLALTRQGVGRGTWQQRGLREGCGSCHGCAIPLRGTALSPRPGGIPGRRGRTRAPGLCPCPSSAHTQGSSCSPEGHQGGARRLRWTCPLPS